MGRGHKMRCCAAREKWFQWRKFVELWDEEVEVDCFRDNESQSMTNSKTSQILYRPGIVDTEVVDLFLGGHPRDLIAAFLPLRSKVSGPVNVHLGGSMVIS